MKNKFTIITAVGPTKFLLNRSAMIELKSAHYIARRGAVHDALTNLSKIPSKLSVIGWAGISLKYIEVTYTVSEGIHDNGKKFIQIGCMRFVGNERTKLLRWAGAFNFHS